MVQRTRQSVRRKVSDATSRTWDVLVFQGGGALGAYEAGAYGALAEKGWTFDVLAGVSIGAANAAIVASRGKEATTFLGRFWDALSDPIAESLAPSEVARRQLAAWKSVYLGNPAMFQPRWMSGPWGLGGPMEWTSLYDPAPYRRLLEKMVDFPALHDGASRLIVTAVDVQSGELRGFDSHTERLGVEHLLASGALPPAFPAVKVGDRYYWDGGLVSNTPARKVLEVLPHSDHRRVVMVELFPRHHRLPRNLPEALSTLKDLTYMRKLDLDSEEAARDSEFHLVMDECLASLPKADRERLARLPELSSTLLRHRHHVDLYLLTHSGEDGELESKDYDFSPTTLRMHRKEGRRSAEEALLRWEKRADFEPFRAHGAATAPPSARGDYLPPAAPGPVAPRATAR